MPKFSASFLTQQLLSRPHLRYAVASHCSDPVDRDATSASGRSKPCWCVACNHHNGRLKLAELLDWDWADISAHLKCTACGAIGYVDTRLDWGEVVNFNKGIG